MRELLHEKIQLYIYKPSINVEMRLLEIYRISSDHRLCLSRGQTASGGFGR